MKRWIRHGMMCLAAPLALILFLCVKNQIVSGVPSVSTLGGMSRGYFVYQRVLTDENQKREMLDVAQMPSWYKWCYDNAVTPVDQNGIPYAGWSNFSKAGGLCFPNVSEYKGGCWPFDYRPLYNHLVEQDETYLAGLVKQDMDDACERPYISGFHPLFAGRWIGYYGKYTEKLISKIIQEYPRKYLIGIYNTHLNFIVNGPPFLRDYPGLERPRFLDTKNSVWKMFLDVYENIVRYTYYSVFIIWVAALMFFIRYCKRRMLKDSVERNTFLNLQIKSNFVVIVALALAIHLTAFVFCQGASDEQERYFMQITPYLFILFSMYLNVIVTKLKSLWPKKPL